MVQQDKKKVCSWPSLILFSHFLQQLHPLHLHEEIPASLAERTVAVPVELHPFADFSGIEAGCKEDAAFENGIADA